MMEMVAAEDAPYGTIYGHIYDAKTKQPVSGAWVYCQEAKCPKQLTDSEGYYVIKNCISPLGNYTIECAKYGYQLLKNVTQTDSSGKANADFSLEPLSAGERAIESSDSLQKASKGTMPSTSTAAESRKAETTPQSGKVSGTGSIKKEYRIMNGANDHANVSLDILNATYYEYEYNIHSDETRCLAALDLAVKNAESITCTGIAKNRYDIPADITIKMKNGDLAYSNSVVASDQGVQASQNIINTTGINVDVNGEALGDDNTILANIIHAGHSESFNGTQKVSAGEDTSTYTSINAIAGPLDVWSYIAAEDRTLNATADVAAGAASINQSINLTDAYQTLKGMTGGANFETSINTGAGNGSHLYATSGSGNLIQLLQRASATDASYEMEYEYMPVAYSTGTYDTAYARVSSDVLSDKKATNDLLAGNCEQLQVAQETDLGDDALTHIGLDAVAGPLDVRSYIATEDRTLNATADVVAGSASINQSVNLTDAYQTLKGVTGGANFETSINTGAGNGSHLYATAGSGNLITLLQRASATIASYEMEYEYMPISYSTGTYDSGYARVSSDVLSDKKAANDLLASHCEQLQVAQETDLGDDALTHIGLDAVAGPLDVRSYIATEDRTLNATADVDAGAVSIDQGVNLTDATQSCKGAAGGGIFFTAITNAERKATRAFTTLGSGNVINLAQLTSLRDAWYRVEYEYAPVSYQTETYDTDLNTSRIDRY